MHLAMPMLVNSTVPANEVDISIELALMTSEMTSLAFSAWHFCLTVLFIGVGKMCICKHFYVCTILWPN